MVTRSKDLGDGVTVVVERSALGQVAEYDAYAIKGERRAYLGGGSKREALAVFNAASLDAALIALGPDEVMSEITCSRCDEKLPVGLVALVWSDTDFFEHGDHLAGWEPTTENFAEARRCVAVVAS